MLLELIESKLTDARRLDDFLETGFIDDGVGSRGKKAGKMLAAAKLAMNTRY